MAHKGKGNDDTQIFFFLIFNRLSCTRDQFPFLYSASLEVIIVRRPYRLLLKDKPSVTISSGKTEKTGNREIDRPVKVTSFMVL